MGEQSKSRYIAKKRNVYTGRSRTKVRKTDLREKVMSQCIVSGIVLIIVLALCLVDNRITIGMREGIKSALAGDTSIESVASSINGLTKSYAGVMNSLNTIFGGQKVLENQDDIDTDESELGSAPTEEQKFTQDAQDTYVEPSATPIQNESNEESALISNQAPESTEAQENNQSSELPNIPANTWNVIDEDFRIDEDILAEINSRVDFYNTR